MLKRITVFAGLMSALLVVGCGPRWTVIRQARPDPFVGKRDFVVMPIDYTGLHIGSKTEEQYLAEKKDKTTERFLQDKVDMNDLFAENLRTVAKHEGIRVEPAAGEVTTYMIKPHIGFMEPGFYAYVASAPSEVILRLRIENKDGKLLDEIEIEHKTAVNSWGNVAAGSRYRSDAEWLGKVAAEYLQSRVNPE